MNLFHVFLLSIAAFLLFKFLAPYIMGTLLNLFGSILNQSILDALLFGAIFVGVHQLNQKMKLLDA